MSEMLGYGERDQSLYLQYILNFDAIWGAGKIIDFLVESGTTLSELAGEIPDFHYIKEEIKCDWKDKGRIIRQIIAENKDKNIELFEGVKINDDKGWALMLPDSERPVFNIYTEGRSEEFAQELSVFFSEKVKNLLKNQRQ
jgi:mannose-1-phosphate guanylyltransferase/phosphomannomutase